MAKAVWALERDEIAGAICMISEGDARAWLVEVWKILTHEAITRAMIRLWAIWHARRLVIHENVFQSPLSTHFFVDRYLEELMVTKPAQGSTWADCRHCRRDGYPIAWSPKNKC